MSVNKSLITNTIKPVSDEEKQMAKSKGERDKRIERYLEALTTLSKRDPDAFESMAPGPHSQECVEHQRKRPLFLQQTLPVA